MRESTKEWLGIKPADIAIYGAFALLMIAIASSSLIVDVVSLGIGLILCVVSCYLGMKPHTNLGKVNNSIKLIAYPACTLIVVA